MITSHTNGKIENQLNKRKLDNSEEINEIVNRIDELLEALLRNSKELLLK